MLQPWWTECHVLIHCSIEPQVRIIPLRVLYYTSQRYVIHVLATEGGPFSYFDRGAIHPRTQSHKYEPPPSAT